MALEQQWRIIKRDKVHEVAAQKYKALWRCVQMHCTTTENGIDVTYSYQKENVMDNLTVKGVQKDDHIDSITDVYIGMFPFENEAHDLFGVNIDNIAIDFQGRFYDLAVPEPMTIISPEKKARMDKARKVAAAKAAKEAKAKQGTKADAADAKKDLEAKLAGMDPEKAAKVRAAMEAKAKRDAEKKKAAANAALEEKLVGMDPEKAAKVRAAMEAKAKRDAAKAAAQDKEGEE